MRRWLVIGMGLLLGACSTYYPPAHLTKAQALKDQVECKALAEQAAGPQGSLLRGVVRNDALGKCYVSRDWTEERP
jgi:hypothetical protein